MLTVRTEIIGTATLYLGDNREIDSLTDGVVLTDPPYGIDHKVERTIKKGTRWHRQNTKRVLGDDKPFEPARWISRKAILWGANHYADKLPASAGWIVWDKRRGGTHNRDFIASDCELAWSNAFGVVRIFSHLWAGLCRESEIGNHYHPTQKPVALMEFCIEMLPVGRILDPYMGSGSTGVAAINMGREFIGVEKDEKYFDIACSRISAAYAQRRLFA